MPNLLKFAPDIKFKSDFKTNAVRPHFNPSFLSPDFHNLSHQPNFKETRWATHNTMKQKKEHPSDPFSQFPQYKVPNNTDAEFRRLKSAGRIPTMSNNNNTTLAASASKSGRPNTAAATQVFNYSSQQQKQPIERSESVPKALRNSKKDKEVVEAAGVPSNCSPFMYFELRKHIRFPSAISTQAASYRHTRSGYGQVPKYKYKAFKYPDEVMERARMGTMNLTVDQCRDYLETREQHRKTHT